MTINFNTEPYYDDFDETKKFYRILYRPAYAVQARELTQMQSILQNQISKFGTHVFKNGAMVIPGQISVDTKISYIKLESTYNNVLADELLITYVGKTISNTNGLKAQVIYYSRSDGVNPPTLFVKYINSQTNNNTTKTFTAGDVLTDTAVGTTLASVQTYATAPTGFGSIAQIEQGVYYIKGHFVLVTPQTIVLDAYSDSPTYRVGVLAEESIVIPEDDDSLLDNAQNSYNYAAPGAHRYYIDLTLTKLTTSSTSDTDFVELIRVEAGRTTSIVEKTDYNELEKTLARRTFDESGNYSVRPFNIDVREHRNNNRGAWVVGKAYLIGDVVTNGAYTYVAKNNATSVGQSGIGPTHTTGTSYDGGSTLGVNWQYQVNLSEVFYNRGIYTPENGGDETKLAIGLEPGKAYVEGYEIEKVSTTYVPVKKARDTDSVLNAVVSATMGNYVIVTNINGAPPIENFGIVNLYSYVNSTVGVAPSGLIGTARVRGFEFSAGTGGGAIGTQTAQYKLSLFDVKLNAGYSFQRDVKSFFFDRSDSNINFTADIQANTTRLVGSVSVAGTTTVTGTGTSFQTDLKVGDYVYLGSSASRARVDAIASQISMTISSSAFTLTGVTLDRLYTDIVEPQNSGLIFQLPNYAIQSVSDITYTAVQKFSNTAGIADSGGTGYCTLTLTTSAGTFASSAVAENYVIIYADTTAGGVIVSPTSITGATTSTATVTLPNTYAGKAMIAFAAINKSSSLVSSQRSKTLTTATPVTFTTQATATAPDLYLGKADGYRIIAVKMKSGTFASPGATYDIDISDRYDFDDGQRATHYDLAKISLKSSYPPPSAPIQVEFQYFAHNGTGDFFTVSSYSNIDYKAIPFFSGVPLRDSIDFRPRIDDNGTSFTPASVTSSLMPKRGNDVICDFTYYLPRKSRIGVNTLGVFTVVDGVSALIPGDPVTTQGNMVLYNLSLEAYTFTTTASSVKVEKIDNKRYTMRDIGKLETRINNLEYYTSLSLLEQQTESLKITDSNLQDRFKNGFIVDNFSNQNVGDTNSTDYLCAIDMEERRLRPFYTNNNVNLIESKSNDATRAAANYKLYGDVITLPVVANPVLIKQPYASRLENINPFAIFTFIGDVTINPSSDDWFETVRRPDIIIDIQGNYASVKNLAEKAGVLGTVWNAWQTVWTGKPVNINNGKVQTATQNTMTRDQIDAMFGYKKGSGNSSLRTITYTQTATPIAQTRTGIKTYVQEKLDQTIVADRTLSTVAIPYIRSRTVLIQIKKLKPSTRFYPFFDGTDISAYCTPATRIYYTQPTGTSGVFNTTTNVGSNSTETARLVGGDSQTCLNRGDVITGGTSGATAVVVGTEYNIETGTYALSVVNCSSTAFQSNETITGSVSGATAKVSSVPTIATIGGNLVTNAAGDVNLLFNIPNTEAVRFRSGVRELKLLDVSTVDGNFTSRARANYSAQGVIETKQATVNSVRNGLIVEEQVVDNQTIIQTSNKIVSDTGWYDPLAQTFLIQSPGGAFLSSIDVFFATKDLNIPVTLEIREVVNGYPGKRVLPFSRVTLTPSQVSLSSNTVLLDGVSVKSYDTPTKFSFPSPVYVEDNTEYCFVLASDSNNYKIWISQLGDTIPGSARTISEQPYAGVMFKSQNASTWTADQSQDITFTIYRCQFDTTVVGNVEFINDKLPQQTLDTNPFEIRTGSTTVRVWHRDHGMPPGSTVTISGVATALNGVPASEFNGNKVINNVDIDSYTITVTTTPTSTGFAGNSTVKATRNIQYDACQPSVQVQSFSETAVNIAVKTTSGQSVDSTTQTPYVLDSTLIGVVPNDTNYFSTPRMVASGINEQLSTLASAKSLTLTALISSTNNALSPIIDTDRTSFITISNKINSATEGNTNVTGVDDNVIASANTTIAFSSGQTITCADTATKALLSALTPGKYLNIAGSGTSANNGVALITAVASDGSSVTLNKTFSSVVAGTAITLTQRERFVDEIAPLESSTYSCYVTKRVTFANPSKYIRVQFAVNLPREAAVEVYYKTNKVGSTDVFDTVNYTLMTPDSTILNYDNSTLNFVDVTYSVADLASFDAAQFKIALKSTNTSAVPLIKDLRIIACA
ncbi:Domain of unknown function DUF4815 [uncultured Caudovirales phage]|uniref:DUF4815 domain-containing protein n=1 Tax=uncultured Caudovirales phage TaxID=2100421 RepID=A0A6J7WZV6_9CAUD|nr:Domain of unknown function DUF4815 [uncultured Caudovirales phage]